MKNEVVRFCQKVSVKYRKIPNKKDSIDVIYLETNETIAIVKNSDRFAKLLYEESMMFSSYVNSRDIKDAVEWIQDVIVKYLQNPETISSYPKAKKFLEDYLRKLPLNTQYTLYNTKRLDIFNKK